VIRDCGLHSDLTYMTFVVLLELALKQLALCLVAIAYLVSLHGLIRDFIIHLDHTNRNTLSWDFGLLNTFPAYTKRHAPTSKSQPSVKSKRPFGRGPAGTPGVAETLHLETSRSAHLPTRSLSLTAGPCRRTPSKYCSAKTCQEIPDTVLLP
jgi:hypothetical protein